MEAYELKPIFGQGSKPQSFEFSKILSPLLIKGRNIVEISQNIVEKPKYTLTDYRWRISCQAPLITEISVKYWPIFPTFRSLIGSIQKGNNQKREPTVKKTHQPKKNIYTPPKLENPAKACLYPHYTRWTKTKNYKCKNSLICT